MCRPFWAGLHAAFAALIFLPALSAGQQADSASRPLPTRSLAADTVIEPAREQLPAALVELADQIHGQARIRVRLVNENEFELLQPRLIGTSLWFTRFEPGGQPAESPQDLQELPLMEISRIQVRKSSAGKGAIIGLLVGAVTLAAVNQAGSPPQWDHKETPLFAILGGGLGAVVGALMGASFSSWSTIYEEAR